MTETTGNEKDYLNVREFAKAVNEGIRQFIKYDKNKRIRIDKSAIDYFLSHDKFDKVLEGEGKNLGTDKSDKSDEERTR